MKPATGNFRRTSNVVILSMAVTLKDIARDLGVSVITVSKALRDHSDISEETKARVLKRVKEMNYRPNLSARALVTGRTHLVGFVVPELLHSYPVSKPAFVIRGRNRRSWCHCACAFTCRAPLVYAEDRSRY